MRSSKHSILIVEHDIPTRALYARELSRDYDVYSFADDHGVPEVLRAQPIRAVVLEPLLPDGRGWALLAKLKQECCTDRIPIILCSTLDERKRGLALGASVYLVKPVLPKTLLEALRCVIDESGY